jgi:hypothetical protein
MCKMSHLTTIVLSLCAILNQIVDGDVGSLGIAWEIADNRIEQARQNLIRSG